MYNNTTSSPQTLFLLHICYIHGITTSSTNKHIYAQVRPRILPKTSILRPQLQNGYAYYRGRTVFSLATRTQLALSRDLLNCPRSTIVDLDSTACDNHVFCIDSKIQLGFLPYMYVISQIYMYRPVRSYAFYNVMYVEQNVGIIGIFRAAFQFIGYI